MEEVIFNWNQYCLKFYVWDYVLFVRIFKVVAMQINQLCSCNVFITDDKQLIFFIVWHNGT